MQVAAAEPRVELISADSMQVYRGMDVGTAKPTAAAQADERETRALEALTDALGNDFEIVRKLGKGSMASVYLAREKRMPHFVCEHVYGLSQAFSAFIRS